MLNISLFASKRVSNVQDSENSIAVTSVYFLAARLLVYITAYHSTIYSPWIGQALFPLSESDDVILFLPGVDWLSNMNIHLSQPMEMDEARGDEANWACNPSSRLRIAPRCPHPKWWELIFGGRPVLVITSPGNHLYIFSLRSRLD